MLRRGVHSKEMAMLLSLKRWDMNKSPCAAHYCYRMFATRGELWWWFVWHTSEDRTCLCQCARDTKHWCTGATVTAQSSQPRVPTKIRRRFASFLRDLQPPCRNLVRTQRNWECSWRPWVVSHFSEQVKPFPLIWRTSARWSTNWCVRMIIYTAGKHSIACTWYL